MSLIERLKEKLGLATADSGRHPIRIFLLEDDQRRCDWFAKRFKGDVLDIACEIDQAKDLLQTRTYDSIFLDHDLQPEHYGSETPDDERTGYAIASFLAARPELQRAATIMVHSFNADGAMRMVEELRRAGRQADYIPFHFLEERLKRYWQR
ncbi:MAG: cyclic-phosphate processing receiver domain-containing protein [Pyrinomonadaceae bacterium]